MSSPGAASPAAVPVPSARAEASRKNGAKSRGPKTPEGKARAAQNALKHGLRAEKYVVLPDEAGEEFAELEAALLEELAPVGALQAVLARRVAVAAWRLARADRIEVELFVERSWGPDATPGLALIRDGNGTRSFETLLRYRGAAMAEFWRALRTLKALQAERAAETGVALAALPARPAAGPPLAQRPQPDEPERAAGPRLENVPSELPFRSHAARARRPVAAEGTRDRPRAACGVGARVPNEPEAAPKLDPTQGGRKPPEPSASRRPNEPEHGGSWRRAERPRWNCSG